MLGKIDFHIINAKVHLRKLSKLIIKGRWKKKKKIPLNK